MSKRLVYAARLVLMLCEKLTHAYIFAFRNCADSHYPQTVQTEQCSSILFLCSCMVIISDDGKLTYAINTLIDSKQKPNIIPLCWQKKMQYKIKLDKYNMHEYG